uniref:EF-hand domain-containing protein n=1 Tax=Magnetococcus massalia (strain MO-1) TaxID=451514 RepID=A0A1S7LE84_MAGMO|nr:Conserved exported protein of unknown function [Candidatus Magnetococcus massalia]
MAKPLFKIWSLFFLFFGWATGALATVVDTGQTHCYDNRQQTPCPAVGEPFYGQDAHYAAAQPRYRDGGGGTVHDLNTGLVWSKRVDARKLSLLEAQPLAKAMTLGGYSDWRVPSIKELYSLIDFRGNTGFGGAPMGGGSVPDNAIPFINTDSFDFRFGDLTAGERYIDAQWLTTTHYVSTTMDGAKTLFGVNFADGRIKGYGYHHPNRRRPEKKFYVRYVRGTPYGDNDFIDRGDGTVLDRSTGLVWMKRDSGAGMDWQQALAFCEGSTHAAKGDWRLPNAKELQGIVDYRRSPDSSRSAALDPLLQISSITNEAGQRDYPYFWSSTTHQDGPRPAAQAVYVAFGRALGRMYGEVMDVHGAGAQRSDPKANFGGRFGGQQERFRGPQGDALRIENHVRCVRGGGVKAVRQPVATATSGYPHTLRIEGETRTSGGSQRRGALGRGMGPGGFDPFEGDGGGQGGAARFVQRLDRNSDGKISRWEFDGPSGHFDRFDRNGDGFISADEAPSGPPPGRGGFGGPLGGGPSGGGFGGPPGGGGFF